MADNNTNATITTVTTAGATGSDQSATVSPGTPAEKTFTQADVDTIVARRLAKAQKGMPSDEELSAFRAWKDSQQTEQEKIDALKTERDTAKTELTAAQAKIEQYEREKILVGKGVLAEDVDYYAFKIGKMVTDSKTFEQAATEYFAENKPRGTVRVDLGGSLAGGKTQKTPNDAMNALIRGARK